MDNYFTVFPNDIKFALSLYLNYRDTISACTVLNCQSPGLWLNKIRNELGYSQEFIRDYVYDNGTVKTLLPLNEKYLELKARKSVDFGCEQYNDYVQLLYRTCQLRDFQLAEELITYLFKCINDFNLQNALDDDIFKMMLSGAARSGNTQLIDRLLTYIYYRKHPNKFTAPKTFAAEFAGPNLVLGIYAGDFNDKQLLKKYNLQEYNIAVIGGLASGNHLQELINRKVTVIDEPVVIQYTYIDNADDVINYYKLKPPTNYITSIIGRGNVNHLPSPEALLESPNAVKDSIVSSLAGYGYLEQLINYYEFLTYNRIMTVLSRIALFNHLDVLNYIYLLYPDEVKRDLKSYFTIYINSIIQRLTLETVKFLYQIDVIKSDHKKLLTEPTKNLMRQYNPEVLNFLQQI